ncbi:MAG TPA: hypothetical protein PLY76_13340, partial [Flavobacteriales bacterium]|nr:hypothetical protein [Flavobacteriales bacterium]
MHLGIDDLSEPVRTFMCAYRHEIRTCTGIIVSLPSDGVPLRQFAGHERISALQVQMASSYLACLFARGWIIADVGLHYMPVRIDPAYYITRHGGQRWIRFPFGLDR